MLTSQALDQMTDRAKYFQAIRDTRYMDVKPTVTQSPTVLKYS